MIVAFCQRCWNTTGHVALAYRRFTVPIDQFCATCNDTRSMAIEAVEGFEELEIHGLPYTTAPATLEDRYVNSATPWALVETAEGEWVRFQPRKTADLVSRADPATFYRPVPAKGVEFWENWAKGVPVPIPANLGTAYYPGTVFCPLPQERQWFQDPQSGEVFTVWGGVWCWVRPWGVIPCRLPLFPLLRRVN